MPLHHKFWDKKNPSWFWMFYPRVFVNVYAKSAWKNATAHLKTPTFPILVQISFVYRIYKTKNKFFRNLALPLSSIYDGILSCKYSQTNKSAHRRSSDKRVTNGRMDLRTGKRNWFYMTPFDRGKGAKFRAF